MDTKILLAVVALVIVLGGGYWYVGTLATPATPEVVVPVVTDVPPVTNEPAVVPTVTTFTLAQVAEHPDRTSCWSAVNGAVYDLTTWIDKHPGGASKILSICGKDGSSAFTNQHAGEPKPEAMLASFKMGELAQ